MFYAWQMTDGLSEDGTVRQKKVKRKARNEVGKGIGKSDEGDESNTWTQ
jgi:hypothetical protein